jgi:hypothetical protein
MTKLYHGLNTSTPGDPYMVQDDQVDHYIAKGFVKNPPQTVIDVEAEKTEFQIEEIKPKPKRAKNVPTNTNTE